MYNILTLIIAESLSSLEEGHVFYDSNGNSQLLSVALLIWLGDHEENNKLAHVYANACRFCYKDENNNTVRRTKEETNNWIKEITSKILEYGQKQTCYNIAKSRGQHFGYVSIILFFIFFL